MSRWIEVQENAVGEWSVIDARLDYRICRYNVREHGGTHVHHPIRAAAGPTVPIVDLEDARECAERYEREFDRFELEQFLELIQAWK